MSGMCCQGVKRDDVIHVMLLLKKRATSRWSTPTRERRGAEREKDVRNYAERRKKVNMCERRGP